MERGRQFDRVADGAREKHRAHDYLVSVGYLPAVMEPPYHYERRGQVVDRNYERPAES